MPAKQGHVAANGVNRQYEIHGSGEPLLLLDGGLSNIGPPVWADQVRDSQ